MPKDVAELAIALSASGLSLRSVVRLEAGEWQSARAVALIGNEGAAYWHHFQNWCDDQTESVENPLDSWSRQVINEVANRFGGVVLMPNDRPYPPFQRWAMKAHGLRPSPIGPLIDARFGLWHAYRGAILFDDDILIQDAEDQIHPCGVCAGKYCVKSCPVGAFDGGVFDYARCLAHVRGPDAGECRHKCIARNACPVGTEWRYPDHVQAFHQKAFAGL